MFLRWTECQECQYRLDAPVFDMPPFVVAQLGWMMVRAGLSGSGERLYLRSILFVLALLILPMCAGFLLVFGGLYLTVTLAVFVYVRWHACPSCGSRSWSWPVTRWDFT